MQDVSYDPLMLSQSENLSSKLGYFQSATPSPLQGLCIHRKAINKDRHMSVDDILLRACLPHARQKGLFLVIALARRVTFCKGGGGMLLVWSLRARSYKTRAEA